MEKISYLCTNYNQKRCVRFPMESHESKIEVFKKKLDGLIERNQSLTEENDRLNAEVRELKEKLDCAKRDYNCLDEKYRNLKLAKAIGWNAESKKKAIDKICGMVREIDYCISFLKNK